jgi:hypothetical protein
MKLTGLASSSSARATSEIVVKNAQTGKMNFVAIVGTARFPGWLQRID